MEWKTILGITTAGLIAIIVGVLVTPKMSMEERTNLPWKITVHPDGSSQVFGLILGRSTLADAIHRIGEHPEITLFVSQQGDKMVEAFFEEVKLGGIRAKMVVTIALEKEQIEGMYKRGLRVSKSSSGNRKVELHPEDVRQIKQTAIAGITYLPRYDLDSDTVIRLFGHPAKRIQEEEGTIVHWIYPEKGLDIALSASEKDVLQYVEPARFEQLLEPLERTGKSLD